MADWSDAGAAGRLLMADWALWRPWSSRLCRSPPPSVLGGPGRPADGPTSLGPPCRNRALGRAARHDDDDVAADKPPRTAGAPRSTLHFNPGTPERTIK